MRKLVMFQGNNLITTSEILAKGTKKTHKSILENIKEHKEFIEQFGKIEIQSRKSKRGLPVNFYYLNEEQVLYLITLMRNDPKNNIINKFKTDIIKEFFIMRKQLLSISIQHSNQIWLEQRNQIKEVRKNTTDIIKKFVEYAKEQGSKNAERYYANITKMENKALFFIQEKYKNIRDILNIKQLDELKQADEIIEKALKDGMDNHMYYKDIYKLAKLRVETFSELKGKSIVPFFNQIEMSDVNE